MVNGQITEEQGDALLAPGDTPPEQPPGLPIEAGLYAFDLSTWEPNLVLQIIRSRFETYATEEQLNPFIAKGCRHIRGELGKVQLSVTDGAHAEDVRRALGLVGDQESGCGLPSQNASQVMVEMARVITDGVYIGAPVWKQDPETTIYFPDSVAFRDPRTLHKAIYDATGRLLGFIQQVQGRGLHTMSGHASFIPISQVIYAVDTAGAGPVGVGRKRSAQILHQIWMETWRQIKAQVRRYAIGLQQICLDPDVPEWAVRKLETLAKSLFADVDTWSTTLADAAGKISAVIAHMQQVVTLPPGLTLKKIGPDFNAEPLLKLGGRCAHSILQLFGAGHLYLGSEGTGGTYNLGSKQATTEEAALHIDVQTIVRAINVGLVDRLYDYNTHVWGVVPSSQRAYLTYNGLDSAAKAVRAAYLTQVFELLEIAQRVGTVEDTAAIRREAGLPALDDATTTAMRQRQATNAALGGVTAAASTLQLADMRRSRAERRAARAQETPNASA